MAERFELPPKGPELKFHYVNHRGELATRRVAPIEVWHGRTDWHPKDQYFLRALDLDKNAVRDFALEDVAFGDPKRLPRFNPAKRRPYAVAVLGLIILVLLLVGVATLGRSYLPGF